MERKDLKEDSKKRRKRQTSFFIKELLFCGKIFF
jgi:hypothetical protein